MKPFKLLLSAIFLLTGIVLFAQAPSFNSNDPLPIDPKVKIGKLDNGLTYYIRANQKPENRVVFFLAVDAGSILETDDQVGLAHFTEHLGFNGTKQYPGNTLIDELEKKGIVFGGDINASTGCDATLYYVVLPTDDSVLFDMGLKILDGWAFGMLMTGDEIEKERGVITEEWRLYQGADERLMLKTLPVELKGSRYANRLPIGTYENLQKFQHSSVRNFYKTWYRTDNMAVIVVGDIDPADMEKKIKDFFTMNEKPSTPLVRPVYSIPDNTEPLIAIFSDPEATSTNIGLNYKQPDFNVRTYGDFRQDLVHTLFCDMFTARISELGEKKNSPFQYGYSYFGDYWSELTSAFSHYFVAKEGRVMPTLELLLTELQRVKQHGYVQTELDRAKSEMMSMYEKNAKEATKKNSQNFGYYLAFNFIQESPFPGDSINYEIVKQYIDGINLDEINKLVGQWITENNITLSINMPEKKEFKLPTEKEVLALMTKCKKLKTAPYVDNVNSLPFLTKEPVAGKVTKRTENEKLGYTELELSNGAKVILKKTDFKNDQIQFQAFSKGGVSLYPDNKVVNAQYAGNVILDCGIGNYSQAEYTKFMMGKQYYVSASVSGTQEMLYGNSTPKDFETFLQYLYMVFEAPRKDPEVFERKINEWKTQISMQKNSPDYQFSIQFRKACYPDDKRTVFALDEKYLSQMNLNEMYSIFRERFSNGSDFDFYFVGNIDIEKAIPLIEKYIGGIPSTGKQEIWLDKSSNFAQGVVDKKLYMGIADKTKMGFATQLPYQWNPRNDMALDMLAGIVDIKLTEQIRENLGGTYGTSFSLYSSHIFDPKAYMRIYLGCEPERIEELTAAIWAVIDEIIANGPTEVDLNKVKEQLCRQREVNMKENYYWTSWLCYQDNFNEPLYTLDEYKNEINSFTIEELKTAAKYMKHDNYLRFILMPGSDKKE